MPPSVNTRCKNHLAAAIAVISASTGMASPPAGFDHRVDALRKQVGVPGIAIAIVENGKVATAKGYGVKKLGAPEPVGADTIFPIGSTGKAFTAADVAILVDQGKVS
jgi:CubicO group peptidase (beta-lactamase class C family)